MKRFKQFQEQQKFDDHLDAFLEFCMEQLQLQDLPEIILIDNKKLAVENRSFGGYHPGEYSIKVNIAERHRADIFRTLAHELTHYKQHLEDRLDEGSGETGSDIENEANSMAGIIMRNFAKASEGNIFEEQDYSKKIRDHHKKLRSMPRDELEAEFKRRKPVSDTKNMSKEFLATHIVRHDWGDKDVDSAFGLKEDDGMLAEATAMSRARQAKEWTKKGNQSKVYWAKPDTEKMKVGSKKKISEGVRKSSFEEDDGNWTEQEPVHVKSPSGRKKRVGTVWYGGYRNKQHYYHGEYDKTGASWEGSHKDKKHARKDMISTIHDNAGADYPNHEPVTK